MRTKIQFPQIIILTSLIAGSLALGAKTTMLNPSHRQSITNTQNQPTVVKPPRFVAKPLHPQIRATRIFRLQNWLIGRRGEIKGVVLSSGVQVKFPRHIGYQLTNLARQGARIEAQGFGSRNSYGQFLEVVSLSVNGQTLPVYGVAPLR